MRKALLFLALVSAPLFAFPQMMWEFGGMLGGSNYLGEIGGNQLNGRTFLLDLKFKQTRFAIGGYARRNLSPLIAYKFNLMYAQIAGADSLSTNIGRRTRNMHFRSMIVEGSAQAEITIYKNRSYSTKYLLLGTRGRTRYDFSAYTFFGVGGFYFNPKQKINGKWTALQPLGTEGQGNSGEPKKYNLFSVAIPTGIGLYYTINRKLRIGYEMGWRYTFTDYLDDISTDYADLDMLGSEEAKIAANRSNEVILTDPEITQEFVDNNFSTGNIRGNPKNKDSYMFAVVKVGYAIRSRKPTPAKFRSFQDLFRKKSNRRFRGRAKFR